MSPSPEDWPHVYLVKQPGPPEGLFGTWYSPEPIQLAVGHLHESPGGETWKLVSIDPPPEPEYDALLVFEWPDPEDARRAAGAWRRGTRGRTLQFYATDEEIAEWLQETLPDEFAPYRVVARHFKDGRSESFDVALESLGDHLDEHREARLWICSGVLSPGIEGRDERELSFGGLILVQLGREWKGCRENATLAIIDRIQDDDLGIEQRHPEYLRIFERLRRSMRKRLVVPTTRTFADGTTDEGWPMTERAADAYRRGEIEFDARPSEL